MNIFIKVLRNGVAPPLSFVDILEVCKFTTLCDRKG